MAKVKYPISEIYYECLCAISMKKHNTIRPTDVKNTSDSYLASYLKAYIDKRHFNKKELRQVKWFLDVVLQNITGIDFTEFKRKKICRFFLEKDGKKV